MKSPGGKKTVIATSAGPRLRCFLGICSIFGLASLLVVQYVGAQVVVPKPLHLSHVHGYVLNETGAPLPGVQVALASGRQPSEAAITDTKGYFDFSHAKGEYLFHVRSLGSASANCQVIVGADVRALFHRGPLYIMIKPVVCEDCVSPIFTNRKQFDRAVREMNGKHD
jgi:hypothetical protein